MNILLLGNIHIVILSWSCVAFMIMIAWDCGLMAILIIFKVINHQPYDQKADVFSFAIVLWELMTAKVRLLFLFCNFLFVNILRMWKWEIQSCWGSLVKAVLWNADSIWEHDSSSSRIRCKTGIMQTFKSNYWMCPLKYFTITWWLFLTNVLI